MFIAKPTAPPKATKVAEPPKVAEQPFAPIPSLPSPLAAKKAKKKRTGGMEVK